MRTVLVLGAGGAAANGFGRAIEYDHFVLGTNCSADDLELAVADERFLIPPATDKRWADEIRRLVRVENVDLVHAQPDVEVEALSQIRRDVPTFLPSHHAIRIFGDKWRANRYWVAAGIPQPRTFWIVFPDDLRKAMRLLGKVWLRSTTGAGGAGAIVTDDPVLAEKWIDRHQGWGMFTAAEVLSGPTVTWTSLWKHGELVACQGRRRLSWANAKNSPSGVSGSTGVGETYGSPVLDALAEKAIRAVDPEPHGLFGVDCVLTENGPVPTEVNAGRFHTTVPEFFARAGFNIADLYVNVALGAEWRQQRNPLPDGKRWIRGMDRSPVLV